MVVAAGAIVAAAAGAVVAVVAAVVVPIRPRSSSTAVLSRPAMIVDRLAVPLASSSEKESREVSSDGAFALVPPAAAAGAAVEAAAVEVGAGPVKMSIRVPPWPLEGSDVPVDAMPKRCMDLASKASRSARSRGSEEGDPGAPAPVPACAPDLGTLPAGPAVAAVAAAPLALLPTVAGAAGTVAAATSLSPELRAAEEAASPGPVACLD